MSRRREQGGRRRTQRRGCAARIGVSAAWSGVAAAFQRIVVMRDHKCAKAPTGMLRVSEITGGTP
jgi:hypothetical protein